ncbi:Predicted ATPase [Nannocystis exedens]|uniref:Predicted ATPase n=1 Tax=Nannocystis exedens TaxID=54 RepID=A0A1I2H7C5_9BACT|nr:AAA family ATPase [Nannocystis exedens]PCC74016.1 RsbT co-antagonist protein RsbRA [Nannocystis exedens]SFF24541.1 Predicted ATPase [Nannocystis exedens]
MHEDAETALYRGFRSEDRAPVILRLPRRSPPTARDLARLQHEYSLLRDLAVPGVVPAHALERHGDHLALVLASPPGEPLDAVLRGGCLPLREALAIAAAVADILVGVHASGIIHKHIKPANIVVRREPLTVHLLGFGLATRLSVEAQRPTSLDALEGTLAYMSPEQTGRMNRPLDLRTDFYSLGATLYHLLTGAPPFPGDDPLELVHSHIARLPAPPRQLVDVPEVVSALVMRLLTKAPEERYQSASGLSADLHECLRRLDADGGIADFPLARHEATAALRLPQRLYGRDDELRALLEAFARVRGGGTELLLVAGYSGIGKSALVHELHKTIARDGGVFVAGKFDQLARNAPYAPFVQAFRDLLRHALGEGGDRLARVRDDILRAADGHAQVLVDLIPELAHVLGPQPPAPELGPTEALNRFNRLVDGFVQTFAGEAGPLVLFLDDLQWADLASLKLLQTCLTSPSPRRLLVVGAYRDNEVGPAHPLTAAVDELRGKGLAVHRLELGPLTPQHLGELLADVLGGTVEHAMPLARVVGRKTDGNPFFVGLFLRGLYQDGLLRPGAGDGAFTWDLAAIEAREVTANVVEFMGQRLRRCGEATQRALRLAACIGHKFTLAALATICGEPLEATAAALWEALEEGLVLPDSNDYRFVHHVAPAPSGAPDGALDLSYHFSHDRVQQAAYALVPADQRADTHLQIGRLLLARLGADARPDELFDVVDHLDRGRERMVDPAERRRVSALDLAVARHAKKSTAYAAAVQYLRAGIALLADGAWDHDYAHAYALHCELAECESLSGAYERAGQLFDLIHARARGDVDRANVYILQMRLYQVAGRYDAGVDLGVRGLALFGVELPDGDAALQAAMSDEATAIAGNLAGRPIPSLLDAPLMTDPVHRAILSLMVGIMPCAYIGRPKVFPYFALKAVNFSLRHGNAEDSCFAYSVYGFMLVAVFADAAAGYAFSEMSIQLNERLGDTKLRGTLLHLHGDHINFWRRPLRTDFPILEQAFHACVSAGDLVYASFLAFETVWQHIEVGTPLSEARRAAERFAAFARASNNEPVYQTIRLQQQFLDSLAGRVRPGTLLDSDDFDARECLDALTGASFGCGIAFHHIIRLILLYTYGRHDEALAAAAAAREVLGAVMAMPIEATFHLYEALAVCARARDVDPAQALGDRDLLRDSLYKLGRWADDCPENFEHKYLLVRAEEARVGGRALEAEELYDQAIASARRNGFTQYEALANALCGEFYRERQRHFIAPVYMRAAHDGFVQWGAPAKAALIAREFPQAAAAPLTPPVLASEDGAAVDGGAALDLATVVRLGQALVGEIELDKLLDRLVRIVMQNAGGTRVYLVLDRDGALELAAVAAADSDVVEVVPGTPLAARPDVPATLVHYVARTREAVVLGDVARDVRFAADPALAARQVKSVLCLALAHRRRTSGILVVENDLIRDAFSRGRVELLQVLCAQAVTAVENALLYRHVVAANERLEADVAQRTADLRAANERLSAELGERERAEQARAAMQEEMIRMQQAMLAELSTPMIPITDAIVVMPLIGTLDTTRCEHLLHTALQGAEAGRMRVVIFDVTGMKGIDTGGAIALLQAASALRLLGARTVLTGVNPATASLFVDLGIDLRGIATHGTLQDGIAFAMQLLAGKRRGPAIR